MLGRVWGAFLYMRPRDEHLKWEVGVIWWFSGVYVGVVQISGGHKCPKIKVASSMRGSFSYMGRMVGRGKIHLKIIVKN